MRSALLLGLLTAATLSGSGDQLDHTAWNTILGKRVNSAARVDYAGIKAHDLTALDAYVNQLAQPWPKTLTADESKAALINAYNALTVQWVVGNYPTESIWRTHHPFTEARHTLDGKKVSLDQIESRLRALGDPRIHGVLVCASLSCPPLRNEAYQGATLDRQLDENVRAWLATAALNQFLPQKSTAKVSMIYKWYAEDFRKSDGSVEKFLAMYAPSGQGSFLLRTGAKLDYIPYRWGINDTSNLGLPYSEFQFYRDAMKNKYF
jgi:hypothetical protein